MEKNNFQCILITGIAGFIGFHLAKELAAKFPLVKIIGVDNLNDYYPVHLKKQRLKILKKHQNIQFVKGDIAEPKVFTKLLQGYPEIDIIFHLAAQAGVRSSVDKPLLYAKSNIIGQINLLEYAKNLRSLKKIIYASSSSIYGSNKKNVFSEQDAFTPPLSLYAATKQAGEFFCSVYSRLYAIPTIGIRFFTAYGEYGRPDMAIYKITEKLCKNQIVQLVGKGKIARDFSYIGDVIQGLLQAMNYAPSKTKEGFQNEVFNLGTGRKTSILEITNIIANNLKIKPKIEYIDKDLTDMDSTLADLSKSQKLLHYQTNTTLEEGISRFVTWFLKNNH
jgi:UDP-glucuronate 4-epimerase